jgi:hypothetical protein
MNFIDKAQLEAWARSAAEDYLSHQAPLNDSIEKIANEYSLNREQIRRVCEFANIHTNLELFEKAADKRFVFDQADAEAIFGLLGSPQEKIASIDSEEYYKDVPALLGQNRSAQIKMHQSWGPEKSASALDDRGFPTHPHELLCLLEAKQEAIRELEHEKRAAQAELDIARESLSETVGQMVMSKEAGFGHIAAAAISYGDTNFEKKIIQEQMIKCGYDLLRREVLSKPELQKLAYSVPSEYVADNFDAPGTPYLVRNGRHVVWSILDTLVRQRDKPAAYDKPLLLLNDDVKYIKRQLTG